MKAMKKITALLAVVVMVLSLVGCGGGNGVAGTYKIESMSSEGMTMDKDQLAALAALAGEDVDVENLMVLELKDDGTFSISSSVDESMEASGTYTVDGKNITMTVDGVDASATIDGKKITIEESGTTMVFSK